MTDLDTIRAVAKSVPSTTMPSRVALALLDVAAAAHVALDERPAVDGVDDLCDALDRLREVTP